MNEIAIGLTNLGEALKITRHPGAEVEAQSAAVEAADLDYQASRRERRLVLTPAQTKADTAGKKFIQEAKSVLESHLGESWNEAWMEAGFTEASKRTPGKMAERQTLLKRLADFLAAHPEMENDKLKIAVTSAAALELHTQLKAARQALAAKRGEQKRLKAERDALVKALRKRTSRIMGELRGELEGDDPRWHDFGLNRPADPSTPEPPEDLRIAWDAERGEAIVRWEEGRRADRSRVERWFGGVDEAWVSLGTTELEELVLREVPMGATNLKLRVASVNAAGDSVAVEELMELVQ